MKVALYGGWGYDNLGDEAILEGYLRSLKGHDVAVATPNIDRTGAAHELKLQHFHERSRVNADAALICGGGYLNGSWVPEFSKKVARFHSNLPERIAFHAVEVRNVTHKPDANRMRALLQRAAFVTVRDEASQLEVLRLSGRDAEVVPDAISLLAPHLRSIARTVEQLHGKVLLNMLDIQRRSDSRESEIDPQGFRHFAASLVEALGSKAVGLVIGEGDLKFLSQFRALPLLRPRTVEGLTSAIQSAAAVYSVRMHPALLASAVRTSVVSHPYCGKVRPTLSRLGVESVIQTSYHVDSVLEDLEKVINFDTAWTQSSQESAAQMNRLISPELGQSA